MGVFFAGEFRTTSAAVTPRIHRVHALRRSGVRLAASDPRTGAAPHPLVPVKVDGWRVIRTVVGLRPFRATGFVLRAQPFGERCWSTITGMAAAASASRGVARRWPPISSPDARQPRLR